MRHVKASATGYKADPATYEFNKLRDRLRHGLKAVVTKKSSIASQRDHRAIKFLLWCAKDLGIDPLSNEWDIDHILPLHHHDLFTDAGRKKVNTPENVRWLPRSVNRSRKDTACTEEELAQHKALLQRYAHPT